MLVICKPDIMARPRGQSLPPCRALGGGGGGAQNYSTEDNFPLVAMELQGKRQVWGDFRGDC